MDYVEPEDARAMTGLRLALTTGVPGPWGEAAKSIFHVKKLDFVPVRQTAMEANEALVEWTGHRNAPIAVFEDEPARVGWAEILALAERLAPTPSLVPDDERDRALMMGLSHALCSEDGLGWNRRVQLLATMLSAPEARENPALAGTRLLGDSYGFSVEAAARADDRVCKILRLFAEQLAIQRESGHEYLMGPSLTAVDVYWATFAALIEPMPAERCPMPDMLRAGYGAITPAIAEALDPALLAHRDLVYERHLHLPMDF